MTSNYPKDITSQVQLNKAATEISKDILKTWQYLVNNYENLSKPSRQLLFEEVRQQERKRNKWKRRQQARLRKIIVYAN
jgi:hypothetical protein